MNTSALSDLLLRGDAISRGVALILLLMSISSWIVLLWKAWLIQRVQRDVVRSLAAFWQAPSLEQGLRRLHAFDREALLPPMVEAATQADMQGTLAGTADKSQQLTRLLRDALHVALGKLQAGQVLLATVGATAPFVGLLGTVWGIYHAMVGLSSAAQMGIDKVAAPVGEALVMTAAGLAVAIPAVLGYNILGRYIGRIEVDLEGFVHDLHELLLTAAPSLLSENDSSHP